jgi:predicted nucleotidyltransferase
VVLPPRDAIDHAPGNAQHWHGCDADVRGWVCRVVAEIEDVLGSALCAVYLHGSLATGSYYRPKSDVDLLVVVDGSLSDRMRHELAVRLLAAFDARPTIGGLELSIVQRRDVAQFRHPLPYDFHFSEKWVHDMRQGGTGRRGADRDLAAHCTVTRARGIALRGAAPPAVLGPVSHDAFVDSIIDDFRWIADGGIHASPFYGVLNICRILHVVTDGPGEVLNKDQGGLWALEHLPEDHHAIITDALECYRSAADISVDQRQTHGHAWNHQSLTALSAFAAETVFRC